MLFQREVLFLRLVLCSYFLQDPRYPKSPYSCLRLSRCSPTRTFSGRTSTASDLRNTMKLITLLHLCVLPSVFASEFDVSPVQRKRQVPTPPPAHLLPANPPELLVETLIKHTPVTCGKGRDCDMTLWQCTKIRPRIDFTFKITTRMSGTSSGISQKTLGVRALPLSSYRLLRSATFQQEHPI